MMDIKVSNSNILGDGLIEKTSSMLNEIELKTVHKGKEAGLCLNTSPQDIKIQGWCPVRSVLPHRKKVPVELWLVTLLVMESQLKYLLG